MMKYASLVFIAGVLVSVMPALAAENPTVALTRTELESYAAAIQAQTAAQIATTQAKPVIDKITNAFAPPKQENK